MTTKTSDRRPYYVAHNNRFSYVRGRDAAQARLAEYLGVTTDAVKAARRAHNCAGLIERVNAAAARAAGV